jgi:hypothetical protein
MPRRRWFQFSLRALLGVVAIAAACASVCRTARLISSRNAIVREVDKSEKNIACREALFADDEPIELPWLRRLMGDEPIHFFCLITYSDESFVSRVRTAFPEATILCLEGTIPGNPELRRPHIPPMDTWPQGKDAATISN